MQYVPPKPVSAVHSYQGPIPPQEEQWWGFGWRAYTPEPPKPPNNFTGPHGRLKWISPLPLHWHNITPSDEDEISRTKCWKLHKKGWVGISVSCLSRYEEKRIMAFISTLTEQQVYKMRPYLWDSDARPGDIGEFKERIRNFYFATPELHAQLVALMEQLPKRTIEMYVDHTRLDQRCHRDLRGLNWHIFKGQDADLLTIEDSETVTSGLVMNLAMIAGVPRPPSDEPPERRR